MRKLLILLVPLLLLFSCTVQKHVVETGNSEKELHAASAAQAAASTFDSLMHRYSLQADSLTFSVTPARADSVTPTLRFTAHGLKVNRDIAQVTETDVTAQLADSTSAQSAENNRSDEEKNGTYVAEPPNVTLMISILAVILVLAIVLLLWLHKKKVI